MLYKGEPGDIGVIHAIGKSYKDARLKILVPQVITTNLVSNLLHLPWINQISIIMVQPTHNDNKCLWASHFMRPASNWEALMNAAVLIQEL